MPQVKLNSSPVIRARSQVGSGPFTFSNHFGILPAAISAVGASPNLLDKQWDRAHTEWP